GAGCRALRDAQGPQRAGQRPRARGPGAAPPGSAHRHPGPVGVSGRRVRPGPWLDGPMTALPAFALLPKLAPGDRVAVLSPSFAAPGFAPAVHEQAMARIRDTLGLVPVEYPTTRKLGATAAERAADINAAFADPGIGAIFATLGGDDQITLTPHLDAGLAAANPKPFFGYSDNSNLLNWLWGLGVPGYYGGSTQVHLGA